MIPEVNKYPKKLYITNEVYKVVFVKRMKDFGDTNPVTRVIRIKAGMSKRETLTTFLHECLHALHFEHGFTLRHKKVYQLEKAIFELLVDNFL